MIKFYQEALSESAKELLNSSAQVIAHAKQLGICKEEQIAEHIIGKEYPIDSLLKNRKTYYGEFDDVCYKAVHVDSSVNTRYLTECLRENHSFLTITVVFLRDPEAILNSRLKLTNEEKKLLRKLKTYYSVCNGVNSSWCNGQEIIDAGSKLSCLKHRICAVVNLSWSFSIKRLLSSAFPIGNLKAEQTLF